MKSPYHVGQATLIEGECLEVMSELPSASIDMVLCDLPYGTTACKWDAVIPFEPLWAAYRRIAKPNSAIVLTASQPFTTALISSNIRFFKYNWIWDKVRGVGFQIAKFRPMMRTEDVVVFCNGTGALGTYNPQMVARDKVKKSKCYSRSDSNPLAYNDGKEREYTHTYPTNVIEVSNASQQHKLHPTQKPVALMEYLIKTYTRPGQVVLDNTMGSGTTGVACVNSGRRFIGIERDEAYFKVACERISEANSL
jgi:site-specific DNA-methyltransferase (adenine-specific)